MTAAANFVIKVSLADANTIRRALVKQRDTLKWIAAAHPNDQQAARDEVGRLDTILRRDF